MEVSRNVSTRASSLGASNSPSLNDVRRISGKFYSIAEGLSREKEPTLQKKRRSASEPVSPRASLGDFKNPATHRRDGSMTRFPKLPSRFCTGDWLTPLGLFEEPDIPQQREMVADLYACGVDAHCGVNFSRPLEMLEESPRQTPAPPADSYTPEYLPQWPTKLEKRKTYGRKAGRSMGASSHRRKSSAKPPGIWTPAGTNYGLLEKLRHYSFMPLLNEPPESSRKAFIPRPRMWDELPLREGAGRKHSSKALLQGLLDGKPASSKSSRKSSQSEARRRRKKTSSSATQKRYSLGHGRVSCSEDQTPHICMDEQATPISGSEITWFE
ncbi:uncharacterized protein F4812DRAFT_34746 [Daldinia caldariorum]|uniref:uncharacterized protein n=1 Tax=Daldinia caldariorum TaxID=326644 RepID=UPI002007C602|nr:uncharacterized protein F4812DRAFT_34746 [Daldinia caldariorum]KAI1472986.1 hypothetical protein F4812DRAFT_34746 [Daldinia caldariorum]